MDLSPSDWIGPGGYVLVILTLVLSVVIGPHFHTAVRNDAARARLIERLSRTGARDSYHAYLRGALDWLDERIGPSPLARPNLHGRRVFGGRSLGVCIALSFAYSIGSWFAGWVAGAPGALGHVTLIELRWAPAWAPEGLPRLLVALIFAGFGVLYWWYLPRPGRWARSAAEGCGQLGRRFLGAAGRTTFFLFGSSLIYTAAMAPVVAAAIALALAGGAEDGAAASSLLMTIVFAVAGPLAVALANARSLVVAIASAIAFAFLLLPGEQALIPILFLLALPWLNGTLDWISLSVSRWFGRAIMAERDSPRTLLWTLGLAAADVILAVAFAFAVAWVLAFGVEATGLAFGLALELDVYVQAAAAAPWTTGFWATFMVLSTLLPSVIHLVLALGAVLVAWSGNPLRVWAAGRLASANEADWLGPQLYLTLGWLVPAVAAPLLLLGLIGQLVGLIEPLPQALADTALHAIATARGSFGP